MFVLITVCARVYALPMPVSAEEDDECIQVLGEKLKEVTPDWRGLGLELRVPSAKLDGIKSNPDKDPVQTKFKEMLKYWLKHGKDRTRTWGFLATAVEKSRNKALSRQIKKRADYKGGERGIFMYITLVDYL